MKKQSWSVREWEKNRRRHSHMRWCTQTKADRPEGEPINYSPPSIIQSIDQRLSAYVCVNQHRNTCAHTHTHTHRGQPSALIWFKMTSQCGSKASEGRGFKLLLGLKTEGEQYFSFHVRVLLFLLPLSSVLFFLIFLLVSSLLTSPMPAIDKHRPLLAYTFAVSCHAFSQNLSPLSFSCLSLSLSLHSYAHRHSQTHASMDTHYPFLCNWKDALAVCHTTKVDQMAEYPWGSTSPKERIKEKNLSLPLSLLLCLSLTHIHTWTHLRKVKRSE